MTPGSPCRLTCPHCGGYKHIMTIASGNTFGGTVWSDSKHDYPMMPYPSAVQHCPHCGHYFFLEDAEQAFVKRKTLGIAWERLYDLLVYEEQEKRIRTVAANNKKLDLANEEASHNGFGKLTFAQVDAAYDELSPLSLPDTKINQLLFLWLFIYNDVFGGRVDSEPAPVISSELAQKHTDILNRIISLNENNTLFVAEMYRELGTYAKCIELTTAIIEANGNDAEVAKQILQHAEKGDSNVFPLVFNIQ